ncbi:cbb3-type cytochrome oxidase assembly protein CcoS [Teredinibacter purpureus]|uniref:cbb3-type cytochrome oxidase assembly protein CcoS n=1 Tax=Teredinibacter purpureus TaxID=2731756 RepID=UPI0005F7C972|nr:cbb3-type cytochrome oxidase assembly protein CcoS [Teredinibacter purpureus]
MQSLLILIPIALVFVVIAIGIFFWAVRSGQYDDLDTEARRILFEEDPAKQAPSAIEENDSVSSKK